jgi:polyhydroxybutyrate depolymerase
MKRALALTLSVLILASTPACAAGFLRDRGRGGDNGALEFGSIPHGGLDRTYGIFVPERVKAARQRVPLVIMLHGGGGYADNSAKMTGLTPKAAKEGFIVVYPEGTGKFRNKLFTWNSIHCCGYAMTNKIDDVGFISQLIDTLIAKYPVDPKRVYVTGLSNGGMMTHLIGAALPHKVAAIAPVISGLRGDEPAPKGPVAAIIINGALDESVPAAGGQQGKTGTRFDDDTLLKPASYQGDLWANANGCSPTPVKRSFGSPAIEVWDYECPAGRDVVRYLVGGNGHAWPGGKPGSAMGDVPTTAMNATDVIWDFFKGVSK